MSAGREAARCGCEAIRRTLHAHIAPTCADVASGARSPMNRRDLNRRLEPNRTCVEPGCHGPVLLETADPAFDRVPGLVVLAVEEGRTATATSAAPAVADLIDRLWNDAPLPRDRP